MRKLRIAVVLLFCVVILSGCSRYAHGPKFQTVEGAAGGKALVYVYRPLISQFKAADPEVLALYIDDERIGVMKIGGYGWAPLDPGPHSVRLRSTFLFGYLPTWTVEEATLVAEVGQEYYLCFEQNLAGINPEGVVINAVLMAAGEPGGASMVSISRHLSLVPKEYALAELAKTRMIGHGGKEETGEGK
jgi:hypothetical protein